MSCPLRWSIHDLWEIVRAGLAVVVSLILSCDLCTISHVHHGYQCWPSPSPSSSSLSSSLTQQRLCDHLCQPQMNTGDALRRSNF